MIAQLVKDIPRDELLAVVRNALRCETIEEIDAAVGFQEPMRFLKIHRGEAYCIVPLSSVATVASLICLPGVVNAAFDRLYATARRSTPVL